MPERDLISIIVPVYNVERYLERCLDSIINQTYKNIEIILVDDGSTDTSGEICDRYADADGRVCVYHTENSGVSKARNLGLKKFKGEYCTFVDADDLVLPEYIEKLYNTIIENNVRMSLCRAYDCIEMDVKTVWQTNMGLTRIIPVDENYDFTNVYTHWVVWGTLYHKSLLKGLKFDADLYVGEDTLFLARVLDRCDKYAYIPEELYCYVIYESSACHGDFDKKKFTEITAWKKVGKLFEDRPEKFINNYLCTYVNVCIKVAKRIFISEDEFKEELNYLIEEVRENAHVTVKMRISLRSIVSIYFFCIMPRVYGCLYRLIYRRKQHLI